MALEEQMMQQQGAAPQEAPQEGEALSDEEEKDLSIAVGIADDMLEEGGYDLIQKAIDQSSDPSQVIGQFVIQMVQQLFENLPQELELSKRIVMAHGGLIEQVMDKIIDEFELEKNVSDRAEEYIGGTIQQLAAKGQQQAQAPQGAPAPAPAMPQGGMPNG